ncbi:hypothetical protein [Herbaspirillum sp. ST 5-3]|uniref:hypothetical protein n=1 Tax=Oxalobacteraceae TaxID=75682 RepID=UPI001B3BF090|nr:hypothetical protein [Herbaspirillum sp. ST 5-3]
MKNTMKKIGAASAVIALVLSAQNALAGPADYVYTPTVEYGEREIDFKAGTAKVTDEARESAASIGFGYGATEHWFTELYVKYKRENGSGTFFDAYEWENKFQLSEPGQLPVDIGFITEIERPQDHSEGWEVKFGPLFQKEFGKTQLNLNILFERNYRAAEANPMRLGYQWQAKYRWTPQFEFGAQGFGDVGKWDHFAPRAEQSHIFGPAIFGKIALGGRQAIKYNVAYLIDANDEKHSNTFRTQVEYEF